VDREAAGAAEQRGRDLKRRDQPSVRVAPTHRDRDDRIVVAKNGLRERAKHAHDGDLLEQCDAIPSVPKGARGEVLVRP